MEPGNETVVRVHREWDGWRSAEVRLSDLEHVHWFQPRGAPHALLHAYVYCTQVVSGDIPHDCERRSGPHRLLVCVLKRHAVPTAYEELAKRADDQRSAAAGDRSRAATAIAVYSDFTSA